MKKKILFVIGSFNVGGAEKSMVNQLYLFSKEKFDVYTYIFSNSGAFIDFLPEGLKNIPVSYQISALAHRITDFNFFKHHPLLWIKKIFRTALAKITSRGFDINQRVWQYWRKEVPGLVQEFDVAIGHMEGIPNYFVIDKVHAAKKVLWIHSQYEKIGYNRHFDYSYFQKASSIVTISQLCKHNLQYHFPELTNFEVLHNISLPETIIKLSELPVEEPYFENEIFHIVSVGRLALPKNYPLAVEAAKQLKAKGARFQWLIIGDGDEKNNITNLIEKYGLESNIILVGARSNPYNYMAKADVIVLSSIYEGKSIVIDEAKILGKIVVTTNYDTVKDSITNGYNGIITEMTPVSLADGILRVLNNTELIKTITSNLQASKRCNVKEIEEYYRAYGL